MSAGIQGGPAPWWQGQQPGTLENLQRSAPAGYQYDPVQMGYVRTPSSAGDDAATYSSHALGGIPSLAGLFGGSGGGAGAPGGGGGGGSAAFGMGGGGGGQPGQGGPVGPGGAPGSLQMPDQTEANNAEFANAKDRAGKISRASIDALNGELGATNMIGSGAQVEGTRGAIQDAAGAVGQVSRDQAVKNASLRADTAKTNYTGNIAMRGQDIAAQEANARLALESRQQQMQYLQTILSAIGGGSGSYGVVPKGM